MRAVGCSPRPQLAHRRPVLRRRLPLEFSACVVVVFTVTAMTDISADGPVFGPDDFFTAKARFWDARAAVLSDSRGAAAYEELAARIDAVVERRRTNGTSDVDA